MYEGGKIIKAAVKLLGDGGITSSANYKVNKTRKY